MALIDMTNKITKGFENNYISLGIFLDLSKAFDTINHSILLHKLSYYVIRGTSLNWFTSYLSNRSQYTRISCSSSATNTVTCGVPQGSLLGPLLFSLYINDICYSSTSLSFILFADDTNVFYSGENATLVSIINTINIELGNVATWLQANRLSLNLNKCNFMIFRKKSNISSPSNCQVRINTVPIKQVSHTKFLGVFLDNSLTWKFHIKEIEKKVSKSIGIISRLKFILPCNILRTLYCSLILPHLSYCNIVWANNFHSRVDKLVKLQKKLSVLSPRLSLENTLDRCFVNLIFLLLPISIASNKIFSFSNSPIIYFLQLSITFFS